MERFVHAVAGLGVGDAAEVDEIVTLAAANGIEITRPIEGVA